MKILIMDDTRKRRTQLVEALQKKRAETVSCYSSNDFIGSLEKQKFDFLMLDMDTWNRGKSIYNYLNTARKLENLPIVFYNANESFSILSERPRHGKDRIHFKNTEIDTIVNSLQDNR